MFNGLNDREIICCQISGHAGEKDFKETLRNELILSIIRRPDINKENDIWIKKKNNQLRFCSKDNIKYNILENRHYLDFITGEINNY